MYRYAISNNIKDDNNTIQKLDIITDLDNTHLYTNTIYKTVPNGDNIYEYDKCLNKFDINEALLDYLARKDIMSKMWMVNPNYIDLEMAIFMANMGQGKYLSKRFKQIYELKVLRYIAGELNIDVDNKKALISEAEDVKKDLYSYVDEIRLRNKSLSEQIEEEYRIEELRSLEEELTRIQGKEDFLLELLKDSAVVRNRILDRQNKYTR
ncbi:MAG: hypothetical protein IKP76_01140 [Bacilli bacterium]|nr:hypothetical protein [Bacilli bacterium]